tara:strand:- start:359 stop:577 length:219 start_codon:yes stop_codon:yes gene_type:complete
MKIQHSEEFQIGAHIYSCDDESFLEVLLGHKLLKVELALRTKEEKSFGLVVFKDPRWGIQFSTGQDTKVWGN